LKQRGTVVIGLSAGRERKKKGEEGEADSEILEGRRAASGKLFLNMPSRVSPNLQNGTGFRIGALARGETSLF
jgi:hypothetical protein